MLVYVGRLRESVTIGPSPRPEPVALDHKIKVAVCVTTYRRPEGLRRLVNGLERLTFDKCEPPDIEIVIVDNDSRGSARGFCDSVRSSLCNPLNYYIESKPGIAHARNKAVNRAEKDAAFIAFIDDDEVPDPTWLDELLYVQQTYVADIVAGPVVSYFDQPVPAWITEGGFFDRPRLPTGCSLQIVRTGNVLIRSEVFSLMQKPFDERFALTGGEDTHFSMRAHALGYKMVWADEALVHEWMPRSRANAKWILRRSYRGANMFVLCELEFKPTARVWGVRSVTSTIRIVQGLVFLLRSIFSGRHTLIKALQHISRGVGMLVGLAGGRYEEYRRKREP